jgi:putative hemolysin
MIPLALFILGCATVYLGTVETAFAALMRLPLRLLAERSRPGAVLGRFLDDPILLFVPVRLLLGLATAVATVLAVRLTGAATPQASAVVVCIMAGFVIVCAQLVPSLIARRDPERVLDVLLPSFDVLARALGPLTAAMAGVIASRRDRIGQAALGSDAADAGGTPPQAFGAAGESQGLIAGDEQRLLRSIVEFGDTLVREVMMPRPDIVAIGADRTLADLRALLREQGYSRIPVFKDSLDNILGFVFVKDVIQVQEDRTSAVSVTTLMRPAYFVPETKRVSDLLKELQRQQVQIAIVVDEYGGTAGLVTVEDLLEEIVGEIRDEYDRESEPITEDTDGSLVVSGKVDIDALGERLGTDIAREGFDTVGGYVLSRVGRVPGIGESFAFDGLRVEILDAERRRVHKIRFRREPPATAEGEPDAS